MTDNVISLIQVLAQLNVIIVGQHTVHLGILSDCCDLSEISLRSIDGNFAELHLADYALNTCRSYTSVVYNV